ncbi:MAG: hypothetical protein MMC33_004585 [Icmadophila ericetorum]|nr:hypothetical protein [Icmadophila ericetorum]
MLDPFTALSVAGNVVQFVQLGCQLAWKAHHVYSSASGVTEENMDIEGTMKRLLQTVQELELHQMQANHAARNRSLQSPEAEARLLQIADACKMLAKDILQRLETLKVTGSPSLSRKLNTTILISIKESFDLADLRTSTIYDRLGETSQRIVDFLLLNRSVFASELQLQTKEIEGVIVNQHAQTRAMTMEVVQKHDIKQSTSASYIRSMSSATESAFATTNEPDWLQKGRGIYWINGKAGSGKSTLMKHVFENVKTSHLLSKWAGSMPLLVANFFFWSSGTREQRSQSGLLRSLLFQILQYQPGLISAVFPNEYAALQDKSLNKIRDSARQVWSLTRLQRAIQRLANLQALPARICLFIDGLDEFEGDLNENDGPEFLIEFFQDLAASPFIKICISSHPLLIFESAFRELPGLRLQDLTSQDIKHYVFEKLQNNARLSQLTREELGHLKRFVKEIADKAQGVFLWVKLVV